MFTVYLFYAGDISQSVRDLLLLSGFYVKKVDSRFAAQPYVILLVYVTIVSIRPRACFFPLFSFLPLWLHYNLNPLCVQY